MIVAASEVTNIHYGQRLHQLVPPPAALQPLSYTHFPLTCFVCPDSDSLPSTLYSTGNFSLLVALEWLQTVIPDIAPNLDEGTVSEEFWFRSTYSGALAMCVLKSQKITFESQSASTVAIFKEGITRQANFRRTQLEESSEVSVESVHAFLELFRNNLAHHLSLVHKHAMTPAIKEVAIAENATTGAPPSWLQGEYLEIHQNSEMIEREYKERGQVLDYITTIITALHTDFNRLQGLKALANPAAVKEAVLSGKWDDMVKLVVSQDRKNVTQAALPSRRSTSNWQPEEEEEGGGLLDEEYR